MKYSSLNKKTINTKSSKLSLGIGVVVLLGATAPFWHIWFDQYSPVKFLGFKNVSVFLYSFGTHFAYFCASSFFFWIRHFIDPHHKNVIKIINLVGGTFVAISAYFLLWIFNPSNDFPHYMYEIAFILTAVFIAYGMYLLNHLIADIAVYKKNTIRNLISFIFRVRNKHYKRIAVKAMYAEEYRKPLLSEDSVEDNANEFEEDFFQTLDKIKTP